MSRQEHDQTRTYFAANRDGALLHSARMLVRCVLLGLVLGPVFLWGQTNTAKSSPSNRCLLIVDTSRDMQRRYDATLNVVQDLVMSGLQHQMRSGDTFGLWTFNDVLHAGQFPLQVWSPESGGEVAARMVDYLKTQNCAKSAKFENVLAALAYVVEHSERLTVILICSGEEKVEGTPFDEQINDYFKRMRKQQQKTRMPFVVVFSTHKGHMINCTMNTPPWPLELPPPIRDAKPAETRHQKSQQPPQSKSATSAPPHTVVAPKAQPPPAKKPVLVASASPTNKPAPTPVVPKQMVPTPAVSPSQAGLAPKPKVEAVIPKPAVPSATSVVSKPLSPATSAPVAEAQSELSAATPPKASAPVATNTVPEPAPPAAEPATSVERSNVPAHAAAAKLPGSAPAATADVASATAPDSRIMLWIAAAAVVVLGAVLLLIRLRRRPPDAPGSLITRSYDRGQKQ